MGIRWWGNNFYIAPVEPTPPPPVGDVVLVTSRASLIGTDFIDWGTLGSPGSNHSHPFTIITNLGVPVDVAMDYFNDFKRWDQVPSGSPTPWQGNFSLGDKLLWTNVPASDVNPISLTLGSGFTAVGTQIQASSPGSFAARVSAYDSGNTLIGFFDVVGESNSTLGTAIFIGIRSTLSLNPIYKVEFSIQPGSSQISSFAINRVELSTTFI